MSEINKIIAKTNIIDMVNETYQVGRNGVGVDNIQDIYVVAERLS